MPPSFWNQLEHPYENNAPVRQFEWPTDAVDYTLTERVREAVQEGNSTFDSVEKLAEHLHAIRGAGFEHSWRAAGDIRVSPSWLTLKDAAVDGESGRVVGVGHLTHEAFGMSPAHDLGAIDGRNAFGFTDAGHGGGLWMPTNALYVGSTRTGILTPLDAGWNFLSADIFGADGTVGTLDFLGSSAGCVAVYDASGKRRELTVIDNVSGTELIHFSPEGNWLLISSSMSSRLVEVTTGRHLTLNVGNAGWWPLHDSALLTIEHEGGQAVPRIFSLATNSYVHTFANVQLDVPLLPAYPFIWNPVVSPSGDEILAVTPAGVTPEYQQQHGVGGHLARITLSTGRGRLVHPTHFDPTETLERDASTARWSTRPPARSVEIGADLAARIAPASLVHEYLVPGRWADEAQRMLTLTLNRAITLTQDDQAMAQLMPEILVSIQATAQSPEAWSAQREWVTGLLSPLGNMIAEGQLRGSDAAAWTRFITAVIAAEEGHPDSIDPLVANWTSAVAGEATADEQQTADAMSSGGMLGARRSKDELFALVQAWLNDTDIVSTNSVSPEEFCSTVDELLHIVPEQGLLDQIQDFSNRTSLVTWANSGTTSSLSDLPWGRVADGLAELRTARGWPEMST